ncbi:hypothetical protein, partial [Mycolicibacterium sp.]|uniref:hypothetical protein n=1 Tax=Mycolicibacterium sp. TaxID=2320850 RepID=UPI0028ABA451
MLLAAVANRLPADPPDETGSAWRNFVNRDLLSSILDQIETTLEAVLKRSAGSAEGVQRVRGIAETESRLAAALLDLVDHDETAILDALFYFADVKTSLAERLQDLKSGDDRIIPGVDETDRDQLAGGVVSPVGIIHLYRQYYFELDTFLGTPVQHVWLAP